MRRKIIGVTVGTTINPKMLEKKLKPVKTVNGVEPDENGNVQVSGSAEAVQANLDAHNQSKKNPHTWKPTAEEVGARPDDWMPTAEEVGARPSNWMPSASDVGAAPSGYGLGESPVCITDVSQLDNYSENGWYRCKFAEAIGINDRWFYEANLHVKRTGEDNWTQEIYPAGQVIPSSRVCQSNWKEPWKIAVAPAGYGLGETSKHATDMNTCIVHGWYWMNSSTANVPDGFQYGSCFVRTRTANQITQFLYDHLGFTGVGGYKMIRSSTDGGATWTEEWENPPMILGVEYRTTKRYNGKALYVIRADVGTLPNSKSRSVPIVKTDGTNVTFSEIVEITGVSKAGGGTNPMGNQGGLSDVWITNESKMTVNTLTTSDLSTHTLTVTIWYTND